MKKIRIGIIAGGVSGEREVSLRSGKAVAKALDENKYEVFWFDPKYDLLKIIGSKDHLDVAFILLHGKYGEDGCIQGLFEILGIPYIGSGVLSSSMALNKKVAKEMYRVAGLEVARHMVLKRSDDWDAETIMKVMGERVIVKPVSEGSSLGISLCKNHEELKEGIKKALQLDEEILVEEYLEGTELTCCVIGNATLETLPLIEIVPKKEFDFFDYEAKYTAGATDEICPARVTEEIKRRAEECAKKAHRVLECETWSRTDMIVRGSRIYVLETNTIPGMTENSLFPLAAKVAGMSLGQLVDRLVRLTLDS